MKPSAGKASALLCASTVLVAALLGLLNGGHYAAQLETAWPLTRPLAEWLGAASEASGLPKAHELFRETVDSCCAVLWNSGNEEPPAEDAAEALVVEEPPPLPQETTPEPPPPPLCEFRDFHRQWLGRQDAPVQEFASFHDQWLGWGGETPCGFRDFHDRMLGKAKAEHFVNTCPVTCRLMLVGDSLMEDFGVYFYRHVKSRPGLQMILLAKFSTGLCRPDYFNWFKVFPENMESKRPHIVIFMMGANDCQPIWYSRGHVVKTRPVAPWEAAYGERVGEMLTCAQRQQALPMWVGMPVMGGNHAALIARTEEVTRKTCARWNVPYVDNRALLADSKGQYQSFMKNKAGQLVRIRTKDQQHMTPEGNTLLVRAAMAGFEELLRQHRLNHPELCVYPEQKKSLATPPLEVVIPYKPTRK